jgi:Family of unknown function (DUF5677)
VTEDPNGKTERLGRGEGRKAVATLKTVVARGASLLAAAWAKLYARFRGSVLDSGSMTEPLPIVGDPRIHKRFLDAHVPLLQEFPAIQNLADKIWTKTLERYNQAGATHLQGEELEKDTAIRLAQIIVFFLARTAFDSFYDVFVLAGNCRGFAAKMMLRVMYEHLVTASFIAIKPEEAKTFDDHASIQKWKVWTRTLDVVPQVKNLVPSEEITKLDEQQQKARAELKSEICKRCGQPITQAAWTRVDVPTMAEQVDAATGSRLAKLYTTCYLMPTGLMHPTPFGLEMRLTRIEDDNPAFNELPESVGHDSLLRAHGLVLRLFSFVNGHFTLGLEEEVEARWAAFPKIWDGALVDPPPMPEGETK